MCDDLEIFGCTDEEACNFAPGATELDGSCTYPGCNDETACNFNPAAGCDDGSCAEDGDAGCIDPTACNFDENAICGDDSCTYEGCTNPLASNYNELAGCDDGSCIVYGCMVDLACNFEPTANIEDDSCEFGTCPGCNDPDAINYNPTSTNAEACLECSSIGETFSIEASLSGGQSTSSQFTVENSVSIGRCFVTVIFSGGLGSWPGDAGIQILSDVDDCVAWGGCDLSFADDACEVLENGGCGAGWPSSWGSTSPGTYTAEIDFPGLIDVLNTLEIRITNAWSTSPSANYSFSFDFET